MADPSSRDMIPKGQPYGERQRTIEGMRQAGLPSGSAAANPQPAGTPPPVMPVQRGQFDALQALKPRGPQPAAPQPAAPQPTMLDNALQSQNPVVREIAARLLRGQIRGG